VFYKNDGSGTTESFSFTNRKGTDIWKNTNGWALSSTAISIDKSKFKDAAKGTVIRIYGAGETNASISVVAGSTPLGTRTRATGMNYEYKLSTAQAAAIKNSGLAITGSRFKLYYVTIDISGNETPAEEETTFTTPTLATGENSIYTSSNGVQLNSSGQSVSNGLSSAGENTEITVHGISDNGNISVTTSDGTALQSVSSSARTRAGSQVSYKFKVQSADVASKVRSGGIKVKLNSGSFKLYMVSAKIVTYTPSTPSTGGKVLYDIEKDGAVSTNGGKIYADASEFTNSAGKTLRIYCSNPQGGWDVEVRGKSWGDMNVAAWNNSNKANINTFPTAWDNGRDYLDIELTDTQASMLAREGMMITIYWITVTQVVLK
jgi:hypothetical protein